MRTCTRLTNPPKGRSCGGGVSIYIYILNICMHGGMSPLTFGNPAYLGLYRGLFRGLL